MHYYDEEAVIQEADIEMAMMQDESAYIAHLRAKGICTHQSSLGTGDGNGPLEGGAYYPEQVGMEPGSIRCTDLCGKLFPNIDAMYDDADAKC